MDDFVSQFDARDCFAVKHNEICHYFAFFASRSEARAAVGTTFFASESMSFLGEPHLFKLLNLSIDLVRSVFDVLYSVLSFNCACILKRSHFEAHKKSLEKTRTRRVVF